MSKISKARSIATDFAVSLVMAVSIGIATSVALAGAVLFIAGHQAAEVQSDTVSGPPEGGS